MLVLGRGRGGWTSFEARGLGRGDETRNRGEENGGGICHGERVGKVVRRLDRRQVWDNLFRSEKGWRESVVHGGGVARNKRGLDGARGGRGY